MARVGGDLPQARPSGLAPVTPAIPWREVASPLDPRPGFVVRPASSPHTPSVAEGLANPSQWKRGYRAAAAASKAICTPSPVGAGLAASIAFGASRQPQQKRFNKPWWVGGSDISRKDAKPPRRFRFAFSLHLCALASLREILFFSSFSTAPCGQSAHSAARGST